MVFLRFCPFSIYANKKIFFSLLHPNIALTGTSSLTRIEDLNPLHGGFLPGLQFLGGIKISSCFNEFVIYLESYPN